MRPPIEAWSSSTSTTLRRGAAAARPLCCPREKVCGTLRSIRAFTRQATVDYSWTSAARVDSVAQRRPGLPGLPRAARRRRSHPLFRLRTRVRRRAERPRAAAPRPEWRHRAAPARTLRRRCARVRRRVSAPRGRALHRQAHRPGQAVAAAGWTRPRRRLRHRPAGSGDRVRRLRRFRRRPVVIDGRPGAPARPGRYLRRGHHRAALRGRFVRFGADRGDPAPPGDVRTGGRDRARNGPRGQARRIRRAVGPQSGQSVLADADETRPAGLWRRAAGAPGRDPGRCARGGLDARARFPKWLHTRFPAGAAGRRLALGREDGRDHTRRERAGRPQRGRGAQAVNRWRVVFGCALVLTLLVGHVLRDSPGYMVHNPDGTTTGDITHYVYWTRLVTLGGIQSAYSGSWPETYAVYPPVTLYPLQAIGGAYRWLQDPTFDPRQAQASLWLHEAIKFVALAWHVLTACAVFLILARMRNERLAAIAASLYVLNPAALFDVAHWAQPDGAHSLFSIVSIGLLGFGQG